MENNKYSLPKLNYGFGDLVPYISEEQLKIHYEKHHLGYVNGANAILEKMEKARKENMDFDVKATLKELSFNVGGHILHSLFWENIRPAKGENNNPLEKINDLINQEFGDFIRFKKEFSQAAQSVEGSGWAALTFDRLTGRLLIMQIEKHNANIYPSAAILMVLDVFEHAYYLDYKNDRAKFIDAFWNIVNWEKINQRLTAIG